MFVDVTAPSLRTLLTWQHLIKKILGNIIDKPEAKSQSKFQVKYNNMEKGNLASGLSLKSHGPNPQHNF